MITDVHRFTLGAEARGMRLDRALALAAPTLSRERWKALVAGGAVRLGDAVARDPARRVAGGEAVEAVVPRPAPAKAQPQDIALAIVHEDEHLLVVDKPAGLVVHPAHGHADQTLVNALLHHCAGRLSGIGGVARPGIVHRIDKDTSGLLVVAKTDRAHAGLARQFHDHSIERAYLAVVLGQPAPPAGRIETQLARSAANRQKMAVVEPPAGKRAVTHWRTLSAAGAHALVECRLETGRTHQVRVHMAHLGNPLMGDRVYGGRRVAGFHRQALHAAVLGFRHPVAGGALRFTTRPPEDMLALAAGLGLALSAEDGKG